MPEHQSSIFGVGHVQRSLGLTAPPPAPLPWTEKYRPRSFAEMFGQGAAVCYLQQFAASPYPVAFLFEGETGTGKTSLALALANELGVSEDWGLHRIKSGAMDAEAVEDALRTTRYAAPGGGWKMVVCDEADSMSPKARQLWLSALEEIPTRTVIVFTSNHVGRFEQRFLDRCERLTFASDPASLMHDAELLADRVWRGEGFPGDPPDVRLLSGLVEGGAISFRRVVQALQAYRRRAPAAARAVPAPQPHPTPDPPAWVLPAEQVRAHADEVALTLPDGSVVSFKAVKEGYRVKGEYRLVARREADGLTHEVHVNPGGWRFEYLLRAGPAVKRAVTHSVPVGRRWAAALDPAADGGLEDKEVACA